MKIINTYFLFGFALLFGVVSSAQTKKWTIMECVEYALKNNISIKQSELDVRLADIEKKAAVGNFLPNLNASGSHSWSIGANINPVTNARENQTTQFTQMSLSSSVDIYNGLQNQNRLRRAKLSQLAAQYQLTKMQDDISLYVANAYLDILFNRENLKVQQAQLANDEKQLVRTQELVDAGMVPRGDLLDMRATVASDKQKVVAAENSLLISRLSLAQLLRLEDFAAFDIADVDIEAKASPVMSETPEAIVSKANEVRVEIKIAKANLDIAERDVKIARGALQPSVSFGYNFGTNASYSDRIIGIDSNGVPIIAGPLPVFDQFSDNKGHNFGVQVSVPIFNGFSAKNNVERNKVAYERSKNAFEQAKLDLETNVYKAITDTKGALNTYEASIAALEARLEAFNYAKEKFAVGMMNTFDYNQAQTLYVNSQSDAIRAKYDYIFKTKVVELYFGIPIIQKP
ncbi:TolC family protein [Flavobacterium sedimenticola]|uniref:TolC family protein n=1 Tax=Flavobacterium sedimenticola TaxID=3043286 RepID=A0ABT6XL24_9FLAO|nr:TolC family protein [Flavobacterium sedimenticola]MDI9255793.1 TolC family protein [Flavobacterium sedimenticola]